MCIRDSPWTYAGSQTKWGAAAKFYKTLPDVDILAMDIQSILNPRGIVFVWATSPRLDMAMKAIHSWGLTFRGVSFVWVKTKQTGEPIRAQGVRPSITKPTCEFVLAASRIAKGRPMQVSSEAVPNVVLCPKMRHSQKPEAVQDRIEQLYPDATKCEMFARRVRPNWFCVGNEVS